MSTVHDEVSVHDALSTELLDGAARLGVPLGEEQCARLLTYVVLLMKWNAVFNLTAVREPNRIVITHLLDSLAIVPTLTRLGVSHVLDVGSGAGLPGIPLAIVLPRLRVELVDCVHKKVAFLKQVKAELQLSNVYPHHARVEALALAEKPDCIVSRAFAAIPKLLATTGQLLAKDGVFVAMKGALPDEELAQLPGGWDVQEVVRLSIPKLNAERCLVLIRASEFVAADSSRLASVSQS